MADESTPPTPPMGAAQIQMDMTDASTVYTNFCQLNMMYEELVLSFGLNTQMPITDPIKATHRVVMNFYTAKRLFNLLGHVINQHEAAFGALELDAQRRVRPMGRPSAPPSTLKPGPA
jgi:Protein of unknown function (DUF3467)